MNTSTLTGSTRLSAVVLAGLLTASLAACGSNDDSTGADAASTAAPTTAAATPAAPSAAPSPKVLAMLDKISGGSTTVTLDPTFVKGLTALKLTPGVVGQTKLTKAGALVFPITGGSATLYEQGTTGTDPFIVGVVEHDGQGITLTGGGKTVTLKNFDVDAGKSEIRTDISVGKKAFGSDVPTFIADGSTLKYPPTMEGKNAILEGTEVKLTAGAAEALNTVFGTDALKEGFPVGVAKIAVH